jgi:hypothetical protein
MAGENKRRKHAAKKMRKPTKKPRRNKIIKAPNRTVKSTLV